MSQFKEVLRLHHEAKLAYSRIARACGLSKGAVSKYLSLAKAQGIGWPLPEDMDEAQLERRLYADKKRSSRLVEPDFPAIHQELKRKGVTLQLLWSEYTAAHEEQAYQYSQFCFHYQRRRKRQKRSMRQIHRAGEKLFIDYCGPTVPIVDGSTGELRQAQVFVAVLGASNYAYAEATWTQELPQWIASHQRAFEFFGGVVELLVPDNLRSGVSKACRYDPQPNATYQELAREPQVFRQVVRAPPRYAEGMRHRAVGGDSACRLFGPLLHLTAIRGLVAQNRRRQSCVRGWPASTEVIRAIAGVRPAGTPLR